MFQDLVPFADIKKEQYIIDHILWDLEPKALMEPRNVLTKDGAKKREVIKGYVFYIDVTEKTPQLFLLRHTAGDYAETACKVEDIPTELLEEAIEENRAKEYFKMYPINDKIKQWLKKELAEG